MPDISQLDRLIAEEPFVRTLAQALLAGEADEVVQQTYMRALRHSGEDIEQPRSWLATVVRNVASNLQRDEKRRIERERDAKAMAMAPSSDDLMEREEQRQRMVAAIDALPPLLRTVLLLRFYEGLAPRHIAQKTGLSNDVVRNRIRRALQLLRERLDQDHRGDRRAWMLALVPIACPSAAQPARATVATLTTTAITCALLATASLLAWVMWPDAPPPSEVQIVEADTPSTAASAIPAILPARTAATEATPAVASKAIATTGSLDVRVLHSDQDRTPAVGTMLYLHLSETDQRAPLDRKICDEHGVAQFVDLPPGDLWISNDRGTDALATTIQAGEHKVLQQVLDPGITLTGTVVDEAGNLVPFARIEGSPRSEGPADAQQFGTANALGAFHIRDVAMRAVVGARARGHLPGIMLSVHGNPGTTVDVQLTVGPPACDVTGVVRDETGKPIANAAIGIGGGRMSGLQVLGGVRPPLPALAQSDENGRFEAWGVPTGNLKIVAVARGRAPWRGTCVTHPEARNHLQISMLPGATIEGTVLQSDGQPACEAIVEVHAIHHFDHQRVRCDQRGYFRLERLAPGTVKLRAHAEREGGTIAQLETISGEVAECSLQLRHGPPPNRKQAPRPGSPVNSRAGQPPQRLGTPPRRGEQQRLGPTPNERGSRSQQGPGGRPIDRERSTATISGKILGPDGTPVENALVRAANLDHRRRPAVELVTESAGTFKLRGLSKGRWRIDIFANSMPPISIDEIELGDGEHRALKPVSVLAGGRLRILLPLDYPANARILLSPATTFRRTPVHHVNGGRETDFLPAGEYEMTVFDRRIELLRQKVTVVAGKVCEVSFR